MANDNEQLFRDIEVLVDGAVAREDITIQQGADISQSLWHILLDAESRPQSQGVPTVEVVALARDFTSPSRADELACYIATREAAAYERGRSQAGGDGWVSVLRGYLSDRLKAAEAALVLARSGDSEAAADYNAGKEFAYLDAIAALNKLAQSLPAPPSDPGKDE